MLIRLVRQVHLSCLTVALCLTLAASACDPMAKPPAGRSDPLPAGTYPRIAASDRLDQFLFFDQAIETKPSESSPM
jgi:hypothetical protein